MSQRKAQGGTSSSDTARRGAWNMSSATAGDQEGGGGGRSALMPLQRRVRRVLDAKDSAERSEALRYLKDLDISG